METMETISTQHIDSNFLLSKNKNVVTLKSSNNGEIFQGKGFHVIKKNGGWLEVYDKSKSLISAEVFLTLKEIIVDKHITVVLADGWNETYDRKFNILSIKYVGS